MNKDQIQGKWRQWMGSAKTQWGKLTDDDLTQIEGDAERLAGVVQERYGYTKEQAQEEVNRFFRDQEEPVSRY